MTSLAMVNASIRNLVAVEYGETHICERCGVEYGVHPTSFHFNDLCDECLAKETEAYAYEANVLEPQWDREIAEYNAENMRRLEADKDLLKSYKLTSYCYPDVTIQAYSFKQAEQIMHSQYPQYLNGANLQDDYGNFLCLAFNYTDSAEYYQDLRALEISSGLS